jgi:GNAT superfamily N-acetyltransferase
VHVFVLAEAPTLRELTFRSKAHWGYTDEFMTAWEAAYSDPAEEAFAEGRVRGLRQAEDGKILGYYALSPRQGSAVELTHLFVEPAVVKQGHGGELLSTAMRQASEMGAAVLDFVSDPHATSFYEKFGAQQIGLKVYDHLPDHVAPILQIPLAGSRA